MSASPRLAVIGASWGGMRALCGLLGQLRADLQLAVAVAQHRGAGNDATLERFLARSSAMPVVQVDDKEPIEAGRVYVGPPDYHLLIDGGHFALSIEGPVRFSRPSIDLLFESAADAFGPGLVAVVLTGANDDGCRGVLAVKEAGGLAIAQDPDEAERPEMPIGAIASGGIDRVLRLAAIADELNRFGSVAA